VSQSVIDSAAAAAAAGVVDVDECGGTLGPCGNTTTAVSCTNSDGSYQCTCQPGYSFNNGACQGTCKCISSVISSSIATASYMW